MSLATFLDQIVRMSRSAYRAGQGRRSRHNAPQFWNELPKKILEKAPCTFVLSTGRCGTQLLTKILRRCGNVDVNHHAELASELQFPTRVAYEFSKRKESEFDLAALCARYEPIQTSYLGNRVFAETNNRITFLAPALHRVFRSSRFIHLVRNPAGFVRSGMNAGFYSGGYYDTGRLVPIIDPMVPEWECSSQLKKIAWLWNETNQFIEDFKATVAADRIMTVRSEDLFKESDVVKQVVEFARGRSLTEKEIQRLMNRKVNAGSSGGLPTSASDWPHQDQLDLREQCLLAERYCYELGLSAAALSTPVLGIIGQTSTTERLAI